MDPDDKEYAVTELAIDPSMAWGCWIDKDQARIYVNAEDCVTLSADAMMALMKVFQKLFIERLGEGKPDERPKPEAAA